MRARRSRSFPATRTARPGGCGNCCPVRRSRCSRDVEGCRDELPLSLQDDAHGDARAAEPLELCRGIRSAPDRRAVDLYDEIALAQPDALGRLGRAEDERAVLAQETTLRADCRCERDQVELID